MVTYFKDSAILPVAAEQELAVARGATGGASKPKGYV
jgi:hypothetical protein